MKENLSTRFQRPRTEQETGRRWLLRAFMKGNSSEVKSPWWPPYLDWRLEGDWAEHSSLLSSYAGSDILFYFKELSAKDRSRVGNWGSGTGSTLGKNFNPGVGIPLCPYFLSRDMWDLISLWILLVETCFQPDMGISRKEASRYLSYGEWGQTAFLVKRAVIIVGWREQLWWSWPRVADKKI